MDKTEELSKNLSEILSKMREDISIEDPDFHWEFCVEAQQGILKACKEAGLKFVSGDKVIIDVEEIEI